MLAVVVVFTGCASDTPEVSPPAQVTETDVLTTEAPSTSISTPSSTSPAVPRPSTSSTTTTTTGASSSTTTSSTISSTTSTVVPCPAVELVVLGNSTDYWPNFVVGVDAPTDDAWPALLEAMLARSLPATDVSVENGSVLGAGFDIGLYGVTSMTEQLRTLAAAHAGGSAVLVVAPSVVDLQLRSLDVDASYEAFDAMYDEATSAFETVAVLPMNPVAVGSDPAVAQSIAEFNRRLVESGVVDPDDRSPLLSDDGLFGRPAYYDDFDDGRLDTAGPDPDGLHPDVDGHAAIATGLVPALVELIPIVCR